MLVAKGTHRHLIGSNRQRKQHEKKIVVGQEVVYTEDAAQVKLKYRVCLGEVAEN